MPGTMVVLMMMLWLLGVVSFSTLGGFVHPQLVYLWFSSFIDDRA